MFIRLLPYRLNRWMAVIFVYLSVISVTPRVYEVLWYFFRDFVYIYEISWKIHEILFCDIGIFIKILRNSATKNENSFRNPSQPPRVEIIKIQNTRSLRAFSLSQDLIKVPIKRLINYQIWSVNYQIHKNMKEKIKNTEGDQMRNREIETEKKITISKGNC